MSHLSQLPLNTLNIDRSFVNQIGVSDNDEAVIRAIIILMHTLRLSVTCEGIETQEQFTYLQELGCDTAQGYLMIIRFRASKENTLALRAIIHIGIGTLNLISGIAQIV